MQSSEDAVSAKVQKGMEEVIIQAAAGLLIGGVAGVALSKSGASGFRRGMAGLGAGIGAGSAWTQASVNIERLLEKKG